MRKPAQRVTVSHEGMLYCTSNFGSCSEDNMEPPKGFKSKVRRSHL